MHKTNVYMVMIMVSVQPKYNNLHISLVSSVKWQYTVILVCDIPVV